MVIRFVAYPFSFFVNEKEGKKEDQVNQQCERYWLKHHHFLYCIRMTVTNLEAMHEYVWMSICVYSSKEKKEKRRERDRERKQMKGNCLSVSCSYFLLLFFSLFVLSKVWCYLGFKWPFIHCLSKCERTHFQVVLETINRKLSCVMIDDLSVCMRASERCFINTCIYTDTHLTRLV